MYMAGQRVSLTITGPGPSFFRSPSLRVSIEFITPVIIFGRQVSQIGKRETWRVREELEE